MAVPPEKHGTTATFRQRLETVLTADDDVVYGERFAAVEDHRDTVVVG